jgi:hypothetical protein
MDYVIDINKFNKIHYIDRNKYIKIYTCEDLQNKNTGEKIIHQIQEISIKTVGTIAPYPIMKGNDVENKLITICYNEHNVPIGCNISFWYNSQNTKIYHFGLVLIIPTYQKQGIQSLLGIYTMLFHYHNSNERNIYFTDIGRSPSAFRIFDQNFSCYPSLKKTTANKHLQSFFQNIAYDFYNNHCARSCGISKKSHYDKQKMVVHSAYSDNHFKELSLETISNTRNSRNTQYNEFVTKLCPNKNDSFIIVFKIDYFKYLKLILLALYSKMLSFVQNLIHFL